MEKVEKLKQVLNKTECIQSFKCVEKEVIKDKDLLQKIRNYQETHNMAIKQEIFQNPLFLNYKQKENDCCFLIMEINQRLQKIVGKKHCR
ncbi:MAG: YlbF family regulator [Bacilli bacterium]|nr:YlbF family regulator [Bacilli bacterium]